MLMLTMRIFQVAYISPQIHNTTSATSHLRRSTVAIPSVGLVRFLFSDYSNNIKAIATSKMSVHVEWDWNNAYNTIMSTVIF
jgi:hypothetical protein